MKKFEAYLCLCKSALSRGYWKQFLPGLAGKAQTLSIQLDSAVVFEEPELLAIGKKTIDKLVYTKHGYAIIQKIFLN